MKIWLILISPMLLIALLTLVGATQLAGILFVLLMLLFVVMMITGTGIALFRGGKLVAKQTAEIRENVNWTPFLTVAAVIGVIVILVWLGKGPPHRDNPSGWQGGHYEGGSGSSHKGGTYRNPNTGDQYTPRKE